MECRKYCPNSSIILLTQLNLNFHSIIEILDNKKKDWRNSNFSYFYFFLCDASIFNLCFQVCSQLLLHMIGKVCIPLNKNLDIKKITLGVAILKANVWVTVYYFMLNIFSFIVLITVSFYSRLQNAFTFKNAKTFPKWVLNIFLPKTEIWNWYL